MLWVFTLIVLAYALLYMLSAMVLSKVPVAAEESTSSDIDIFLRTNGTHTDLVVPVKSDIYDWSTDLPYEHTRAKDSTMKFVGIGWGNKGFYLDTPTWSELKFSTAFNAVFGLGSSAMHTTFYPDMHVGDSIKVLHLSTKQYEHLVQYIRSSFALDSAGRTQLIETNAVYCDYDAFYEGTGHYTMFHTCNTWTNSALKVAGQRACVWTPFQGAIMERQ